MTGIGFVFGFIEDFAACTNDCVSSEDKVTGILFGDGGGFFASEALGQIMGVFAFKRCFVNIGRKDFIGDDADLFKEI